VGAGGRHEETCLSASDLDFERRDPAKAAFGLERPRGPELLVW